MSALLAYIEEKRLVMASDVLVFESDERYPKFRIFQTRKGPVLVGGVGWLPIIDRLLSPLQQICNEQGLTISNLSEFLPGAIDFMLKQRKPESIDEERDIKFPPAHILFGGFDHAERRMRLWMSMKNGVGTGTTIKCAMNDFAAIGFLESEDTDAFLQLHKTLQREGRAFDTTSVARILGAQIDEMATRHPGRVGRAAVFAAIDDSGLIQLPADFPAPNSECAAVAR